MGHFPPYTTYLLQHPLHNSMMVHRQQQSSLSLSLTHGVYWPLSHLLTVYEKLSLLMLTLVM